MSNETKLSDHSLTTETHSDSALQGRTPGPWAVRANGVFLRVVHGEHKVTVADGIVSETNARLIAAAPELLDALESCRLELDYCQKQLAAHGQTGHPNDSVSRALAAGAAAIAKAAGGEA